MNRLSNGYVMGFLCGYMRDRMDPAVFGYHRGYTLRKTSASGMQADNNAPTDMSVPAPRVPSMGKPVQTTNLVPPSKPGAPAAKATALQETVQDKATAP